MANSFSTNLHIGK